VERHAREIDGSKCGRAGRRFDNSGKTAENSGRNRKLTPLLAPKSEDCAADRIALAVIFRE
jgi:hypothetical protein